MMAENYFDQNLLAKMISAKNSAEIILAVSSAILTRGGLAWPLCAPQVQAAS
jgi:hypothetical protein